MSLDPEVKWDKPSWGELKLASFHPDGTSAAGMVL
jgi:hypothetical protein